MNKEEFIKRLSAGLGKLPEKEKQEILYDYIEHFEIGLEQGKKEEEICSLLGDPFSISKEFNVSYKVTQAQENPSARNIISAVFATIGLGLFNLIFVLGPFLGLVAILISFFVSSISIILSGFILVLAILFYPSIPSFISLPYFMIEHSVGGILFSIGMTCLGILMLIGTSYFSVFSYKLTIKYLKFNLKIITNRRLRNE